MVDSLVTIVTMLFSLFYFLFIAVIVGKMNFNSCNINSHTVTFSV